MTNRQCVENKNVRHCEERAARRGNPLKRKTFKDFVCYQKTCGLPRRGYAASRNDVRFYFQRIARWSSRISPLLGGGPLAMTV